VVGFAVAGRLRLFLGTQPRAISYMDTMEIAAFVGNIPSSAQRRSRKLLRRITPHGAGCATISRTNSSSLDLRVWPGDYSYITREREWQQTTTFLAKVIDAHKEFTNVLAKKISQAFLRISLSPTSRVSSISVTIWDEVWSVGWFDKERCILLAVRNRAAWSYLRLRASAAWPAWASRFRSRKLILPRAVLALEDGMTSLQRTAQMKFIRPWMGKVSLPYGSVGWSSEPKAGEPLTQVS